MSGMTSQPVTSLLPADIETLLENVQTKISNLDARRVGLENDIGLKEGQLVDFNERLRLVNEEIQRADSLLEQKTSDMNTRERSLADRESALAVYTNALAEKEKTINKYLAIFDNMKAVINR